MGMNIVVSSFGIPDPAGGNIYLCDAVICTAALLLDPFAAFAVGGIGSFLGDAIFYPAPIFVSLVTHGLQAACISLIYRKTFKKHRVLAAILAVSVGAVIMVTGYALGKAFIYGTPAAALVSLPHNILQSVFGGVFAVVVCHSLRLKSAFDKIVGREE